MSSQDESLKLILGKELKLNDEHVLKKRKQYFNSQLTKNLESLSFVLVIISYLNTLSLLEFLIRLSQQLVLTRPFPKSSADMRSMSLSVKKLISKSIFQMLVTMNILVFLYHVIFTCNINSNSNVADYSHGSWTLQIVGEKKFSSWFLYKCFILLNDIMLFLTQLTLYFITCLKNENLVEDTSVTVTSDFEQHLEVPNFYDGYSGNTTIIEIDPLLLLKQIKDFKREPEPTSTANDQPRSTLSMPGGFEAFTNLRMDDFV